MNLTEKPDLILPDGPEMAQIMFVGDSGTEEDRKNGRAFSGRDRTLHSLCKESGINYDSCYKTLFIKDQLAYNGPKAKLKKEALAKAFSNGWNYKALLIKEILQIQPRIVVPMGELSFNFLSGHKSITQFRGSILEFPEYHKKTSNILSRIKIAPILPIKNLWFEPQMRAVCDIDFDRIKKCAQDPSLYEIPLNVSIADTYGKFREYYDKHAGAKWGVFDIETRFNVPVCIGFCLDPLEAICVPLVDQTQDSATISLLWDLVDKLLRAKLWVNQNIKFDILNLERIGFQIPKQKFLGDTTYNAGLIYPEFKKNLGFLNSIYTNIPYFKGEGKEASEAGGNRAQLYLYCAKDCISTYRIWERQMDEIRELHLESIQKEVNNLFWPYVKMEKRGVLVDNQQKNKLFAEYDVLYNIQRSLLDSLCNKKINPHSPDQISDLIYGEWKLPAKRNRQTDGLITDEDALCEHLAFNCEGKYLQAQAIEKIINCRKIKKVLEYLETPIHPDNRLRSSYNLSGTKTGRSSAGSTTDYLLHKNEKGKYVVTDCGRSLQTISKHGFKIDGRWYGRDLRSIYVPTPGYIFCEFDGSQAEARVDAVLAEDFDFLPLFDIAPGVHVKTGTWIFGREINKKKEPDLYHIAKTVRHAGERNMGAYQFFTIVQATVPGFTIEQCELALTKFHESQPNIRNIFHFQVTEFVKNNRYLITPHGRRRDFFGKPDHHMLNEAISQIPQGTVSDHTKFSIPRINAEMGEIDFVYEAHDGIMAEIKKDQLERFAETVKRVYERPINFIPCTLTRDYDLIIPCEISWSDTTWEDLKSYGE